MQARDLELPGADGISLHALEWSSEGVPLVFVHGFGNDAHVWDEIAPSMAPHYRTLAITLRGHGDSGRGPAKGGGLEAWVRDLESAFDHLDIDRLVLVGHSLGGRIAMLYAARNPQKLAGLVLVDAAPQSDPRGSLRIREEMRSQLGRTDPSFASLEDYQRVLARQYPAARNDTLERLSHHWVRPRADGRYELKLDTRSFSPESGLDRDVARERARAESERLWDALRRLPCPALVVRGAASDVLSADVADEMAEDALPNGRLAVIPKAGHSVMLDNPGAFTQALSEFVLG